MPGRGGTRFQRVPRGERRKASEVHLVTCEEFDKEPRTTRRTVEEGAEV
jgi:hypothetical protein